MKRDRRGSCGFVLVFTLVLMGCATLVLAGVLGYALTTTRISAGYIDRTPCRLAAHAAIDKVRGEVYRRFKEMAKNRSLLFGNASFSWFSSWSATSVGTCSFGGDDDIFPNGTFNGCRVRVNLRFAPVIESKRAIVTYFATATRTDPVRGTTASVTIAKRIAYGVDRSRVFDHAYFVNNYGWFEGSTITANGDVRANGDMSLSKNPKVNGHVYGARNDELGVPGQIKNGTGTMDNKATYTSTQYGVNNRARPLQTKAGDGGYDAPVKVTSADLDARLHGELAEGLDMPWISDLNQYVEYARELKSTLKVGNQTLIAANDGYYKGVGPSGDANMPDNHALILEGTSANPIRLNGPVVVSNDVVIKGYVTGQGTIYSSRNIHIVGDVKYLNPPDWTGKKQNTSTTTVTLPDGKTETVSVNSRKDLLGLAAKGNIVMGDPTSWGWLDSTLKTTLTTSPYVQQYTCAQAADGSWSDGDIGYPRKGESKFCGNYTANDGGAKVRESKQKVFGGYKYVYSSDGSRRYYDSVVAPHEISSRASTITQIDAVLYNNHGIFGRIGPCTINGSVVCRNEGIIFSDRLFLNWDYRLYSGSPESVANALVGMPVATATPEVLSWQEVPDAWNADTSSGN